MSTSGRNSASSVDKAAGSNKPKKDKLRSACDNCAGAKVRCTKEQPICHRCQRLELECVYGPSQRRGKPPMNRRSSHTSLSGPITSDLESMVPLSDRLTVPEAAWVSNRIDSENAYFPTSLGLASSGSWDSYPTLSSPELAGSFVPIAMPPPSLPYEISSDSQVQSLSGSPYASYSSIQGSAFPSMSTIHMPAVSTYACFNEASAALNALYCSDQQAHIPVTVNSSLAAGGMSLTNLDITSPQLDTIRNSLTTVTRLSTCDCSICISDRSMPYLLVTVISKILDCLRNMYIYEFRSTLPSQQHPQSASQALATQWAGAASNTYNMTDPSVSQTMIRDNRSTIASALLLLLQTLEVTNEQQLIPRLSRVDDAMGVAVQQSVGDMLRQNITNLKIALEAMRG